MLLVIVVLILLFGGGFGGYRAGYWGPGGGYNGLGGILGLVLVGRRLQHCFQIDGHRAQVVEIADAGGQLSDIEIMMDSGVNGQSDRRAIWPGMCDHFTAPLHRVRFIRLADQDQGRRRHR